MADAICLQCGTAKRRPWAKCGDCGLDPRGDEEQLVKSVFLSVGRFEDADERRRYAEELDALGQAMKRGALPTFDERALARLRAQKAESMQSSAAWGAVVRLFLPGVGLLLALMTILMVLRALR